MQLIVLYTTSHLDFNRNGGIVTDRLKDKVAIVIGATSGIGQATAELFAAEGAKVVFTGRRAERGNETEAAIRAKGGEATFLRADSVIHEEFKSAIDFFVFRSASHSFDVNISSESLPFPPSFETWSGHLHHG